jgi:uncharacterized protein (UPF0332 family)
MPLHTDLLEQAQHLARREPRRPRQASLRRAVSAAYYALFHLLIRDATVLLGLVPPVRGRFTRAFDHGVMKQASQDFTNPQPGRLPALTGGAPVPAALGQVASTFVTLQEMRHEADYNVERRFTRAEVNTLVAQAQQAFRDWRAVRTDPVARSYLAALLLGKKWIR